MIQLHKIKLFISVILEKILITSDIMVVSVSRLVVKSRSRSWLCDLSPEPTSVGDGDSRESFLTYKLLCFILGFVLYAYLTWFWRLVSKGDPFALSPPGVLDQSSDQSREKAPVKFNGFTFSTFFLQTKVRKTHTPWKRANTVIWNLLLEHFWPLD